MGSNRRVTCGSGIKNYATYPRASDSPEAWQTNASILLKKAHNLTLIIMIYVDDLGLFTTLKNEMAELKKELKDNFTMTDLGEMNKILSIQVIRDQKAST